MACLSKEREIIKIKEGRLREIISELDLFSRILIGQYGEIVSAATGTFIFTTQDDLGLASILKEIRGLLIPAIKGYGMNGSLGIWSKDTPLIAKRAFDIQQCLRYQLAYHKNPSGGITVDFGVPFIHGEWHVPTSNVNEYHEILKNNNTGEYRKGYAVLHPWCCPIIIKDFKGGISIIIDDKEVLRIMDFSKKWTEMATEGRICDLFRDVRDLTKRNVPEEKFEELIGKAEEKIKEKAREYKERFNDRV